MDWWKSSPDHRHYILNPDSTLMGLGVVAAGQEVKATLLMVQPTPGGATAAQQATVPNVVGMKLDKGKQALVTAKLGTAWIRERASPQDPNTIIEQSLQPGTRVPPGTTLNLVVAAPQLVTVPDLTGLSRERARQSLESARLRMGRVEKRASQRQEGTILKQNPKAGMKVPALSAVSLVTAAPDLVAVPRVVGLDQEGAEKALDRASLQTGSIEERPSGQATGTVLGQNPEAGQRVAKGTSVNLVVATPQLVSVPKVLGLSHPEAQRVLETAQLRVGTSTDRSSSHATGTVLIQDPAPDTRVSMGSAVNLVTAVQVTVTVPRVVELSRDEAQQAVIRAGLEVGQVEERASERQAGTVLEQNPDPGGRVPVGSPVHLTVAVRELVTVPDLQGLDLEQARTVLAKYRLQLGGQQQQKSDLRAGTILRQDPAPGSRFPVGVTVSLWIASPSAKIIPKAWIVIALLAIIAGGYYLYSKIRRSWGKEKEEIPPVPPPLPAVAIRPHKDLGSQKLDLSAPCHLEVEVRLKPMMDRGTQQVEVMTDD